MPATTVCPVAFVQLGSQADATVRALKIEAGHHECHRIGRVDGGNSSGQHLLLSRGRGASNGYQQRGCRQDSERAHNGRRRKGKG